jgi:hypothetical protein
VDEELYRRVVEAARKSSRTVSEEIIARVTQSLRWDELFGDYRKFVSDTRAVMQRELRQAMIDAGYTAVHHTTGTLWAEPESEVSEAVRKLLDETRNLGNS